MTNRKPAYLTIVILFMALFVAVFVAGCTSPTPSATPNTTPTAVSTAAPTSAPTAKTDLTVFAAASLADGAFNDTKAKFEVLHPEANIIFDFDGSQQLRTQIEQGAYADVFASASTSHMNTLKNESYMNNSTIAVFAKNKLAIAVPKSNPANISGLADLSKPGIKLVVCDKSVPCGNYTIQMVDALANNSSYGPDYRTKFIANEVSQETNVNFAISKVALGEADAAIVYVSDVPADMAGNVTIITIPDGLNVVAIYPIGVTAQSKNQALAKAFEDYVESPDGQAILKQYGFITLNASS